MRSKSSLPATLTKEDSLPTYLKINTGSLLPMDKVYLRLAIALVSNDTYSPCAQVSELIYRGEGEFVIDYADMIVEP